MNEGLMTTLKRMTPQQYQAAIDRLGLSQRASAAFLGINERQVRKWLAGEARIPHATARLLRLMVKLEIAPEDVP